MKKTVGIFWDFDNTYYRWSHFYGISEEVVLNMITEIRKKYDTEEYHICAYRAYADFEKIRNTQSLLQRKRVTPIHVFSSNPNSENRKNAGDIELCLDALESVFNRKPEMDVYVILSADRDMIPLINRLRSYGKIVHLFYVEKAISDDRTLLDFPDMHQSLEELLSVTVASDTTDAVDLNSLVEDAQEVVNKFNVRNSTKPNMFLGKRIFVSEMIEKKGVSEIVAKELLEYCLAEGYLTLVDHPSGNKSIISP